MIRDKIPLPSISYLGATCTATEITAVVIDYSANKAVLQARASVVDAQGEPVPALAFNAPSLSWSLGEQTVTVESVSVGGNVAQGYSLTFSLDLTIIETLLA